MSDEDSVVFDEETLLFHKGGRPEGGSVTGEETLLHRFVQAKGRIADEERRRVIEEARTAPGRFDRYLEWARDHRCSGCGHTALVVTVDTCYGGPAEHRISVTCPSTWPWEPRSCCADELAGVIGPDGCGIADATVLEPWGIHIRDEPHSYNYLEAIGGGWAPSGRQPVQLPEWLSVAEPRNLEEEVSALLATARDRHELG